MDGDVYMAAKLPYKQIAKSEEDLLAVYAIVFVTYFETVISCIYGWIHFLLPD